MSSHSFFPYLRNQPSNAGQWRDRAEELRSLAEDLENEECRQQALRIAAEYDRLAYRAEE